MQWEVATYTSFSMITIRLNSSRGAVLGKLAVPFAMWKLLPDAWLAWVDRLQQPAEGEGR